MDGRVDGGGAVHPAVGMLYSIFGCCRRDVCDANRHQV